MRSNSKLTAKEFPKLIKLMKNAYPDYKGKKFFLCVTDESFSTVSYWDGGSRDYFKFVKADGSVMSLPESHPFYQHTKENREAILTTGLACVKRCIFMGRECGLTLMLHPSDMPKVIERKE